MIRRGPSALSRPIPAPHTGFVADIVDPLGGSYAIESLTDEIESKVTELLAEIEELGGAAAAIEAGFQQSGVERNAYRIAEEISSGQRTLVGVNAFTIEERDTYQPLRIDPQIEYTQVERLTHGRDARDQPAVDAALADIGAAASGTDNVLYPIKPRPRLWRNRRGNLRCATPRVGNLRGDTPSVT